MWVSFALPLLKSTTLKRILLALLLISPLFLKAQEQHHEIGVQFGVSNYYGDLQPRLFASNGYHPMGGIIYKFFMNPHIGLRFGAAYTTLSGADSLSNIEANRKRNLSFGTHLFEMHGGIEINALPVDIMRFKVTPYAFGGIGAFYFNPYAEDPSGSKVFLRPLSTEGQGLPMYPDRKQYSLVNLSFPVGGGMKFFVGKAFFITTEVGFRYTNTDYLDDVSKSYVDLDTLGAYKGKLAKTMAYRGNTLAIWDKNNPGYGAPRGDTRTNDWYWFANMSITVYFRSFGNAKEYVKTRCPGFYKR
ncbi:MAG: hypothetical protein EBZ77_10350, partial [Chitinophagia bacterium]|nr:hypothetical protein [Chitinophagia bacterium]